MVFVNSFITACGKPYKNRCGGLNFWLENWRFPLRTLDTCDLSEGPSGAELISDC